MKRISKKSILEASKNWRNYQAMKKLEDRRALIEYGFSNTGELKEIKDKTPKLPLTAGIYNLVRQMLP